MSNDTQPKAVVNPSQVERMLKGIDKRIAELDKELVQLRKQRLACEVLLSPEKELAQDLNGAEKSARNGHKPVQVKRSRQGVFQKIQALLQAHPAGLSVPEITEKVKEQGELGDSTRPEGTVYVALKRHPELFQKSSDGGKWQLIAKSEP